MASYLDAHPELRPSLQIWSKTGQMVPIVQRGELVCFVNHRRIEDFSVPCPLSAEDFVVGLEVLGHSFDAVATVNGRHVVFRGEPEGPVSTSWDARANALIEAYGRGRVQELNAFLERRAAWRDGAPHAAPERTLPQAGELRRRDREGGSPDEGACRMSTVPLTAPEHEHTASIAEAASWLAVQPVPPSPVVPALRTRFGLSALEACAAIREATLKRARSL